jgi:hypothetical protein
MGHDEGVRWGRRECLLNRSKQPSAGCPHHPAEAGLAPTGGWIEEGPHRLRR